MKDHAVRLLLQPGCDGELTSWLDAEGGSLIGTLRKAWGDDAFSGLADVLRIIVVRWHRLKALGGIQLPAATETCALAVAHLLPVLQR